LSPPLIEACVEHPGSAVAAVMAGAGRLELCAALSDGGMTPSAGMIRVVRAAVAVPVHVLIRPRVGDYVFDPTELDVMVADILEARRGGVDGVVIGALTGARTVDRDAVARLVSAAGPLGVTFHRAVDQTADIVGAVETLAKLGVQRVLTSGGAATAEQGIPTLRRLVQLFGGRVTILAGGRVRSGNAARIVRETGVRELHLGPRTPERGDLDVTMLEQVIAEVRSFDGAETDPVPRTYVPDPTKE